MNKELLFQQAANIYFDILQNTGKPPRLPVVIEYMCEESGLEKEMVKSILSDPDFDQMLAARRKKRIIEEVAFKLLAAEVAERIGIGSLEKLAELIETGTVGNGKDCDLTAKDLIAAAKLASDLNAEVDKGIQQITGTEKPQINIHIRELLMKTGADRVAVVLEEVSRELTSPKAEVIDGSCTEG